MNENEANAGQDGYSRPWADKGYKKGQQCQKRVTDLDLCHLLVGLCDTNTTRVFTGNNLHVLPIDLFLTLCIFCTNRMAHWGTRVEQSHCLCY